MTANKLFEGGDTFGARLAQTVDDDIANVVVTGHTLQEPRRMRIQPDQRIVVEQFVVGERSRAVVRKDERRAGCVGVDDEKANPGVIQKALDQSWVERIDPFQAQSARLLR